MISLESYQHDAILASAEAPIWVTDESQLESLCEHWSRCALIALDTEFIRTDTYYPIPGLIQLSDDHACYLIDPLAINHWDAFKDLLENPEVIKVFHAPGEDLELFKHSYSTMPTPILDTQMAAAFVGWGQSMGLQRMLRHAFDVELSKDETRSDWLQRPLTQEQERYAALDVAYLPRLADLLLDELERLGRLAWVEEEMTAVLQSLLDEDAEMRRYYLRFSQLSKLSESRQAALRDLSYWRERMIRELNEPRGRFLSNKLIIDIMKRKVGNLKQLSDLGGVRGWVVGNYGMDIINFLKKGSQSAEDNPPEMIAKPLSHHWHTPVKELLKEAQEIANELDMPIELLCRKRDVEALIRYLDGQLPVLPKALQGWRDAIVAQPLINKFHKMSNT